MCSISSHCVLVCMCAYVCVCVGVGVCAYVCVACLPVPYTAPPTQNILLTSAAHS